MTTISDLEEMLDKDKTVSILPSGEIKMEGEEMMIIIKGFLSDVNGRNIKIGDTVEDSNGHLQ